MWGFPSSALAALAFLLVASVVAGSSDASAGIATSEPSFPLAVTPAAHQQIETAYRLYAECFNRRDVPCFTRFYNDDLTFVSSSLPRLVGKQEMVRFFRDHLWKHLREHLVVKSISVAGNRLSVDLENTLTVFADYPDFPPRPLKKGDRYTVRGIVVYILRDGRISKILDGVDE